MFGSLLAGVAALLLSAQVSQPGRCQRTVADDTRRQDAIRFVIRLNAAQVDSHRRTGAYLGLSEVGTSDLPVGFVPRLVSDRWTYVITVSDLFDRCGFTLVSDERGVVFQAQPLELETRHPER